MSDGVVVRTMEPGEFDAMRQLSVAAFGGDPVIGDLLDALHESWAWDDNLSYIAERDGELVGQVLYTHAILDAPPRLQDVLVLSPIGVRPDLQRHGIGTDLITSTLSVIGQRSEPLVFLEGHPTYYPRFGFRRAADLGFVAPSVRIPRDAFMVYPLPRYEPWMTGTLIYPDAFWRTDAVGLRPGNASLDVGGRGNMPSMVADPLDASAGVPYDVLAGLRDACPVSRTPSGAYFLARHDDVLAATKNIEVFQASFRAAGVVVPAEEQLISEIPEPRHGKIRRIINSAIAQHRISRLEPFIRTLCHELLDRIVERGGGDLVADYVTPIPATVIAHLLGVDPADHARFAQWSDLVVQSTYATKNRREDGADGEGLAGVAPDFTGYLDAMIAERKASADPPDDFVTRLINTEVDGERLTDLEMRTQLAFLLMSGNETTRHLIANLLETVCTDAALFARLHAERDLVPTLVEESLRHDPPIHVLMRDCLTDITIDGVTIPAGVKVGFGLASANRDERTYDDPDEFRLDRPSAKDHLAFGGGPHVCPGASLARLEGRVALEVFIDRVNQARVDRGYRREPVPVFWANGPRRLPVNLTGIVLRR